jgi:FMN phosphatase YigB (HAD superfamily)
MIGDGTEPASKYLIHGAYPFLEHLAAKGLKLAILSSTVQERVIEEAERLGLRPFFGRHIYGGTGDPLRFSKRAIFERLLAEEGVPGRHLLSFGDGPVELRDTKELGGLAVAVCSDEDNNGSGVIDPHKRSTLFAVGADAAIPDYRDAPIVVDYLLGQ